MPKVEIVDAGKEMRLWEKAAREILGNARQILGENLAISSGTGDDLTTIWWCVSVAKPYVSCRIGRWTWWRTDYVQLCVIERNHSEVHLYERKLEPMILRILRILGEELDEKMTLSRHYNQ